MTGPAWPGLYGLGVGTTGVIFAAIAIAWLAYLVPHFVRRREGETVEESVHPAERFSESMRIVRHGTAPLLDQDLTEIATFEVSTPQTRRAAVKELRRLDRLAATRRRRVLLTLLAVLSATVGICAAGLVGWGLAIVPGALLVAFVVVARLSVREMRRSLDERYHRITQGSDEKTIFLSRKEAAPITPQVLAAATIDSPKSAPGGLWDPVPITMPTYVSKPLAPRTVRTIDLSGPGVTSSARRDVPVTADAPAGATALDANVMAERESDGDEQQAVSA